MSQLISPCLWFDDQAEEAVEFYLSVFRNSRVIKIVRYSEAGNEIHGKPPGSVLTIDFEINSQTFTALNGGPAFNFNEAISLQVNCASQEEIDYYWKRLTEGGDKAAQQCGWLKDKYGVSWQVVPTELTPMLADHTSPRARQVMDALLKMKKLDIGELKRIYEAA